MPRVLVIDKCSQCYLNSEDDGNGFTCHHESFRPKKGVFKLNWPKYISWHKGDIREPFPDWCPLPEEK
jgi:hypothetical protein